MQLKLLSSFAPLLGGFAFGRNSFHNRRALHEARLQWQLVGCQAHRFLRDLGRNTLHLEEDLARANNCNPMIERALARLAALANARNSHRFSPLWHAAESCFGNKVWPSDIPVPQAWIEFDVEDVEKATAELEARGFRMLIRSRTEPWGQTVTSLLSPEGLLVGITFTPWMR